MRIRIKFRKFGVMRFVGHLDIMRYFQKAMRRANIDIAYTEGFSPHQIMSFAAPLGLGLTSDGEYLDIEVNSTADSATAMDALNAVMVEGMEITSYVALRQDAKKAMTAVAAADYIVYFKKKIDFSPEELPALIRAYYEERESIEITKEGKPKRGKPNIRTLDFKPLIYAMAPSSDKVSPEEMVGDLEERCGFFLRLCSGSTDNIKPELVLQDFYKFFEKEYDPFNLQIHRLEVYEQVGEELLPLSAAGDVLVEDVLKGEA